MAPIRTVAVFPIVLPGQEREGVGAPSWSPRNRAGRQPGS
jgi:hypothetical protein